LSTLPVHPNIRVSNRGEFPAAIGFETEQIGRQGSQS
jgi:hypothetical protein